MIHVGEQHTMTYRVDPARTVPDVLPESPEFASMPRVLATAYTVAIIEWAAMQALRPHLEQGQITVGTHIDISHDAPTLPGMTVTVQVTCTAIEGRQVWFEVEATDQAGPIASGRHARAILDQDRFVAGVNRRDGEFAAGSLEPGAPFGGDA